MYGQRLWILILDLLFLVLTSIMTVMALQASWSDHAGTPEEYLLVYAITSAGLIYIIRSFAHPDRDVVLFNLGKTPVRVKVINRIAALMFFSILAFAVWNHEAPHFAFTALAILFVHLELWFFYKKWAWRIASLLGLFGFAGGFFFHWYSIGWGESFVALPAIVFVLRDEIVTLFNKK